MGSSFGTTAARARTAAAFAIFAFLLAPIPVTAQTITAAPTTVPARGTVTVTIANGPGNTTDWVALYPIGANAGAYLDWQFLNGQRTAPATGLTAATLTFTMPAAPGTYEFRFFPNNTFTLLATTAPVTVTSSPTITVTPNPTTPGSTGTTGVTNSPGGTNDWL